MFGEVCRGISETAAAATLAVCAAIAFVAAVPGRGKHRPGKDCHRLWRTALLLAPFFFLAGSWRMSRASAFSTAAARAMETGESLEVSVTARIDGIRRSETAVRYETVTILELSILEDQTDDSEKSFQRQPAASLTGAVISLKQTEKNTEAQVKIGDLIYGQGTFTPYDCATNFGQFDARAYYKALGLEGRIVLRQWQRMPGTGWFSALKQLLEQGRQFLTGRLAKMLPAPEDAGLLAAILLGDKTGLSQEDQTLFQNSGISHIYAVSGLHISFVAQGLYGLCRRLGASPRGCSVCSGICLALFVLAVGSGVSVKRAGMMFFLTLLAGQAGRTYDLLLGCSAACLLVLWQQPLMLFQPGFQLSFCAVAGIGLALEGKKEAERVRKEREKILDGGTASQKNGLQSGRQKRQKRLTDCLSRFLDGLTVSLWIQLLLLPATLWHFFQYPCCGILLNLIVIPLAPAVMALGFLGLAAGCIWTAAGSWCLIPVQLIFLFWRGLCQAVQKLPFALWVTGRPKAFYIGAFCGILLVFYLASLRRNWFGRRYYAVFLSVLLFGGLCLLNRQPEPGLLAVFLDVGQGDGIFIQEESGHTMMIDGGSSDAYQVGTNRILPLIKASGADHVDDWFLSHPDTDHLSGLEEVLEAGFPVDRLWIAGVFAGDEKTGQLAARARENGTAVCFTQPGQLLSGDGFSITSLYPAGETLSAASANDGSMVLLLEYEDVRLLFPGDLETTGESWLLSRSSLPQCQVLKVGHHGSKGSTGQPFLDAVNPALAVISCGKDNSYGHPHQELLDRLQEQGCQTVSTASAGAITLRVRRQTITYTTSLPPARDS